MEHNRLNIMESLRPSKKRGFSDFKNFFVNEVFNPIKAFTVHGMYGDYSTKRHKLKQVIELVQQSSNLWGKEQKDEEKGGGKKQKATTHNAFAEQYKSKTCISAKNQNHVLCTSRE